MAKKATKQQVELSSDEMKNFVKHMITNNRYLQERGKIPVTIGIEGEAGIGKTSSILQIAEEEQLDCVKLNLSQIEEIGDLVGYPHKEFEVRKEETSEWIPENMLQTYIETGYVITGEKRMTHAAPEWIQGKGEGGILILDDYTRADQRFVQATMEIIDRQQYVSWKLPKDWHVILTTNPDNGDYLVTSLDPAQETRFISVKMKFDIECWAAWAEKAGIDGRCINFLLMHPEYVNQTTNARSITTFFNSISSIEDFSTSLPTIQMVGEGSVGTEFATAFTLFINNKLDKLITPQDIFNEKWPQETMIKELRDIIGIGNAYRPDIASTMNARIFNWSLNHAENHPVSKDMIQRLQKLATEDDLLGNDLQYTLVKKIIAGNKQKFQGLLTHPKLIKQVVK